MLRGASLFSVSAERREPPSRHSLGCESHHPEQIGHASLGRHEDQQKLDASSSASSFRRPCTGSFKAVSHVARLTLISNLTSIVEVLHHLPLPGKLHHLLPGSVDSRSSAASLIISSPKSTGPAFDAIFVSRLAASTKPSGTCLGVSRHVGALVNSGLGSLNFSKLG